MKERTKLIKRFCQQNEAILKEMGICWHEPIFKGSRICNKCGMLIAVGNADKPFYNMDKYNPTFSHPEEVLAVCMKWDDWHSGFSNVIGVWEMVNHESRRFHIITDYITTPDKLLEAAVEWREK